jgi:hypothetical protein
MKKLYLSLVSTLSLFLANAQTTVSLTADRDNTMYSSSGATSNGTGEFLFVGQNAGTANNSVQRALVHFNTAAIPTNAVVTAATLTMVVTKSAAVATGVELHKVSANWGEGTSDANGTEGTGAPATTNDATWSHRLYPSTTWANAGGDFSPTVSASQATVGASIGSATTVTLSGANLIADIQSWVTTPANNLGWLIMSTDESAFPSVKRFISRNSTTTSQRPSLSITYTLPVPVTLKSFSAALRKKDAVITWSTVTEVSNAAFEVEHSEDGARFSALGRILGNGNSTKEQNYSFTHSNISTGKHYYRLAQYDVNGAVKYSQVVVLSSKATMELQLQPNPTTALLTITASSSLQGARFSIVSAMGQTVQQGTLIDQKLNVNALASGQYWLNIETAQGETLKGSFIRK